MLNVALILPFGEPREGFFDDTVLGLLCAEARAAGHSAEMVRVYYDGQDDARDAEVRARLEAWLEEHAIDLVVVERLFDPAPVAGRTLVQITRGDSIDPVEGVDWVIGAAAGLTVRGTTRTPTPGGIVRAFRGVLDALAAGGDPRRVPGVGTATLPATAALTPAPLPSPFAPVVAQTCIALGEPPEVVRKTIYGNVGCPFAADPMKNPRFEGVTLPDAPVARLGCAFCSMGGDYEKRPDARVVEEVITQARYYLDALPTLEELLLNDQHSLRYLAALMDAAADLRPTRWLFAARADAFVRERERVREAVAAASRSGHTLEVYLSGFEAFSDETLERYNKGVTSGDLVRAVNAMRALKREAPDAFEYARTRGHSLILWHPWTTRQELRQSALSIRANGLGELFDELGRNRLRLYRDLPITYAAARDGATSERWEQGDEGAGRRKGYNVERPWRFLDDGARWAYPLASRLRARLGAQTEVAQLLAVSDPELTGAPPDVDAALSLLERATERLLARDRDAGLPARGAKARASVVSFAGACNNGCAACANRDAWLDDAADALVTRIRAARAEALPVMLAGREPTVHPAILDLIGVARGDDGRAVGLVTNGRRFAYAPFARAVIARGLTSASVKLFAPDAVTADRISRDAGGHAQAIAGIEQLAARCALEIRAPLHRANVARFAEYAALAARLGAPQLRVDIAIDAIGLAHLEEAAAAIEELASACRREGVALEASPLASGPRSFGWMPTQPR